MVYFDPDADADDEEPPVGFDVDLLVDFDAGFDAAADFGFALAPSPRDTNFFAVSLTKSTTSGAFSETKS